MNVFSEFGLSQPLVETISKLGFDTPTQIQQKSIPSIMQGKDVIGESATGSGKTLAFGCGMIDHIDPSKGLQGLVLTPTRELSEQVKNSLWDLSKKKKVFISAIYGGVAIGPQIKHLERANIVVATPGRLLDHLERKTIDLSSISILVLDEVDRMLDMGFIEHVEKIIQQCPKKRQTLFFSATISSRIKSLAKKYMHNAQTVSARTHVDPSKLKQVYYDVKQNLKLSVLHHLLEHEQSNLIMVFCNTRRTVDFVVKNLKTNKIGAIAIHGGLTQNRRSRTLELFDRGKVRVLVCTDVAARGLHIDNVTHVYNYEIPQDSTDYVHRIGRTARAGEQGMVINLLSERDHDNFSRVLHEHRNFKIDRVETPYVQRIVALRDDRRPRGARFGRYSRSRN